MNRNYHLSKGVTLIELIVSMVIITVAVSGVMALFVGTTSSSADPMIRAQQLAIAQSYMDEIMMQPYSNDGATSGRENYNEVDDYNAITAGGSDSACSALSCGIRNQFADIIDMDSNGDDLAGYAVEVNVAVCTNALCASELTNIGAKKITITVTHAGLGTAIPIIAYRTNY